MKLRIPSRIEWLQLLTVVTLVLPFIVLASYVGYKHEQVQQRLDDMEPRYARLTGLQLKKPEFAAATEQVLQQLLRLSYPADLDVTQAGNDAQQRIRSTLQANKVDVSSIQILPAQQEGAFDRIPLALKLEGDMTALTNALGELYKQEPFIWFDSITMQAIGAVLPVSNPRLGAEIKLSVMRVRP